MFKVKTAYRVFLIAATLFVAKPFIGFTLYPTLADCHSANLLVKVFAKRKPEDLREADERKTAVARQLNNPPLQLVTTIFAITALFFAAFLFSARAFKVFEPAYTLYSPVIYLLTGKLVI